MTVRVKNLQTEKLLYCIEQRGKVNSIYALADTLVITFIMLNNTVTAIEY